MTMQDLATSGVLRLFNRLYFLIVLFPTRKASSIILSTPCARIFYLYNVIN